MKVVDMHCDTISGLLHREKKGEQVNLQENHMMIDLTKMRQGDYLLQTFAAFVNYGRCENALESALEQIDLFYRLMAANQEWIRPVGSYADIVKNQQDGVMSALLSVEEGGACKGNPAFLRMLYRLGVRMMTLTWNYENELAFPNESRPNHPHGMIPDTEHGLKAVGFDIIEEMERLGMIVDVSHLSDAGFWDVYHHTKRPFIASHSNARRMSTHCRNLTDDMIKALAERGGVTGINYCNSFLAADGRGRGAASTEEMSAHIRYLMNLGGEDLVGLGSDFDGIDTAPQMQNCAGMQQLADQLAHDGFTTGQIEKVFYKNVLRVFEEILK
ncbi:MAG: dipeptidase [Firmicutes bacterium]|nr:dipeptidase [Bacillota bacterium]